MSKFKAKKGIDDLKIGDKVKWVGNRDTQENGYCGIGAETIAKVAALPYLVYKGGNHYEYPDGSNSWFFYATDYGTLFVDCAEPERKFQVGDKVLFKSRNLSELKGRWSPQYAWCGQSRRMGWDDLKDDHVFTVLSAPYHGNDSSHDVTITSDETPGTWFSFASDLVLVPPAEEVTVTDEPPAPEEKVKLTKQQKSAKRLLKYLCKAQLESRVLRQLTTAPSRLVGEVNTASLVCDMRPSLVKARAVAKELGIEQEDWQLKA